MADSTLKSYSTDPALYLYTSLTSGSSHVVTATSRLETILKANKVPFKAIDIATDEKARMLWGRRSGKDESGRVRKLPGLVQMGLVVGVGPDSIPRSWAWLTASGPCRDRGLERIWRAERACYDLP